MAYKFQNARSEGKKGCLMEVAAEPKNNLVCGTLVYTKFKLALVFLYLMIAGFCYSISLTMPARLLPIQMESLSISDSEKYLILATIGGILNMTVCPYISFKSDRYRSRFGRRIPFILISLPFLVVSLLLFAYTDRMGVWLSSRLSGVIQMAPATSTILLIALVMTLFQFFYMYVGSVIWYLFDDIIPPAFFGRIMGAFNVASGFGNALFTYFLFKYAKEYYSAIFIWSAVLYGIGMTASCLLIKEGEYPPPPPEDLVKHKTLKEDLAARYAKFISFFKETFSHRFYVMRFSLTSLSAVAGASYTFGYFFNREMGLNLEQIGRLGGIQGAVTLVATFIVTILFSVLIDRWHPMRISIYMLILMLPLQLGGCVYLFGLLPPETFIMIGVIGSVASCVAGTINGIAGLPMQMLTLPKTRFGQFCAAQALLRSTCTTIVGLLVGVCFDLIHKVMPISETFHYRFVPVWVFVWSIPTTILAYWTYREWGRLGGYRNFAAPTPWLEEKTEKLEQPEVSPPSAKLLRFSLILLDLVFVIGLGAMLVLALRFLPPTAAHRVLVWAVPAEILVILFWLKVRISISMNIRRSLRGEPVTSGIPHHGMMIVFAVWFLSSTGVILYSALVLNSNASFPFLCVEILKQAFIVLVVWGLTRMERGIVEKVHG